MQPEALSKQNKILKHASQFDKKMIYAALKRQLNKIKTKTKVRNATFPMKFENGMKIVKKDEDEPERVVTRKRGP